MHRWQTQFDEVWPDGAPQIIYRGNPEQVRWHGVHLFPNGDLLINLEIEGFPYAGGLVKINKDSKVLWKVERNTHHAVKVRDDGTMFVPALNYHAEPLPGLEQLGGQIYEDVVLEISPDGEIIDEISMPQALAEMKGVLRRPTDGRDPTHLNDVEVVTAGIRGGLPAAEGGRSRRLAAQSERAGRHRPAEQARDLAPCWGLGSSSTTSTCCRVA